MGFSGSPPPKGSAENTYYGPLYQNEYDEYNSGGVITISGRTFPGRKIYCTLRAHINIQSLSLVSITV